MRAHIGPFPGWFGPYQLSRLLQKIFRFSDEREEKLAKWLDKDSNWIGNLLKLFHNSKFHQRKVSVRVDWYDSWNADHTLALIILPVIKQLKENKHGFALIDDEDVPEELRSTNAPPTENECDWDDNAEKRYDWLMNEIIWAFEQIVDDDDEKPFYGKWIETDTDDILGGHFETVDRGGLVKHRGRIANGTRLFGKYYQSFWD